MDNSAYVVDCDKNDFDYQQYGKVEKSQDQKPPIQTSFTFNEAISMTKIGKFHYLLLLTCGTTFLSVMIQIMIISIILPAVKCDLEATLTEQGFLASSSFLGVVLSSHAMGFFADTWGRVSTLKCSLLLSMICSLISAFSVNIWMLIVLRFLTGIFVSGGQACVFSLCGEYHGDKTRVRHVTLLSVFLPVACIYIPAIAIFILPMRLDLVFLGILITPWRILLIASSLIAIFPLIGLAFTPETPKFQFIQGNQEQALETLRMVYHKNTGLPKDSYPVKHVQLDASGANIKNINSLMDAVRMVWSQTVPLFYRERVFQTINICVILFSCYGISHGMFMWYPTILNDLTRRDGENVCLVISEVDLTGNAASSDVCTGEIDIFSYIVLIFVGVAFTVVYLVFAYTIDFVGKRNLLIIWLALCAIGCVLIHWLSNMAMSVIVLTIIIAVGNCGGLVSTISIEYFPTNISAMAMCFIMMIGRLGAVACSNIFGHILFKYCDNVFWGLAGIIVVLAFMSWLLPEKKRQKHKAKTIDFK